MHSCVDSQFSFFSSSSDTGLEQYIKIHHACAASFTSKWKHSTQVAE